MVKVKQKRSSKINAKTRLQIRKLYDTGNFTQKELAERFGITQPYVCQILRATRSGATAV